MNSRIEEIVQDIRDLRDDDSHVCPADKDDYLECTCTKYDHVIDKLEDFTTELIDLKLRKLVNQISVSVAYMLDDSWTSHKDIEDLQDLVTELESKIDPIREKRWD